MLYDKFDENGIDLKLQLYRTENSQFHQNVTDFPNIMDPGPRSKYPEISLWQEEINRN